MPGMPAARKLDLTVHVPVIIITGSPDTKIGYLPAARLNDVGTPCPLPPCKPPMPKIVSSSKSVFINNLGAARVGDFVNDAAAAKPPGPGGCSHAPAKGYQARKADHYEAVMAVEHEQSDWDVEDTFQRQAYDGSRDAAPVPSGVTGGAGGSAKKAPSGKGKGHGSSGTATAHGGSGGGKSSSIAAGGGSAVGGGAAPGKGGGDSLAYEDEAERPKEAKKLDLAFPLDLTFGKAKGKAGYGAGMNKIALGCFTVIVG
ncbi:MAG TPA: hypothetical protein ENK57_18390 [Polyangiaceae bacterium]|nr:hypothetical protein [Polyangiaceae bacterium]